MHGLAEKTANTFPPHITPTNARCCPSGELRALGIRLSSLGLIPGLPIEPFGSDADSSGPIPIAFSPDFLPFPGSLCPMVINVRRFHDRISFQLLVKVSVCFISGINRRQKEESR
jgi:hypothetical protein